MMYYYAYLDERDIVQMIYSMPAPISSNQFILIPTNDQTLIGKKYNRKTGEFEEIVLYYYAVLGEKDIVTSVIDSEVKIVDSNKIQLSSKDLTLIGKWYNRETKQFINPPIHILAELDTEQINIKNQDKWLQTELNEMKEKQGNDLIQINTKIETGLNQVNAKLQSDLNQINTKLQTLNAGVFGGYKCHFRMEDNQLMSEQYVDGKRYTFNFNTGIAGYFPKMIRLVSEDAGEDNLIVDLYMVKDSNGLVKLAYLDKTYLGIPRVSTETQPKRRSNHDVDMSDYDALFAEVGRNGVLCNEGALSFIQSFTMRAYAGVGIFEYTENTLSFSITISEDLVGYYTDMRIEVYVY